MPFIKTSLPSLTATKGGSIALLDKLYFGTAIDCNEVFIKGIVNGAIGITYKLPLLSNGKYAQVSLSLNVTEVDPYDASTVFTNGSFRGVVKSLKRGMNLEE